MRILLLSPYDALSHRYWREGLVSAFPQHDFTVVTLPDRYFSWRFRGNSLTLAHDPVLDSTFDLIVATSMTDLSALKGMKPALAAIPSIVYCHENQFEYPASREDPHRLDRQITSLYTAISADRVVFNSAYNRDTFLNGADRLLAQMPDHVPEGVVSRIREKSRVLPVPVAADCRGAEGRGKPLSIVWNHRWEHDKGPAELLEFVEGMIDGGSDFEFHLLGQQFRQAPAEFERCVYLLAANGRLGLTGFLARHEYIAVLRRSHIVLSTALHEFQGLSVLEAVACGCTPVVPDRLVYPELFDLSFRYKFIGSAVERVAAFAEQVNKGAAINVPDVTGYYWSAQRPGWESVLTDLV